MQGHPVPTKDEVTLPPFLRLPQGKERNPYIDYWMTVSVEIVKTQNDLEIVKMGQKLLETKVTETDDNLNGEQEKEI